MTNDVKALRNFFIAGVKPQDVQQNTTTEAEVEESKEYDKRLDALNTGDEVILTSTNQRVKIVKTWGKEIIVNTPNGNKCVAKNELAYIEK